MIVVGGNHHRVVEDKLSRNTAYLVRCGGRIESQDKLQLTPQEHGLRTPPLHTVGMTPVTGPVDKTVGKNVASWA